MTHPSPVTWVQKSTRQVPFYRLRKHKIALNPKKCVVGVPSEKNMGHTIDSTGHSFSREKIEKALMTPPAKNDKNLRSFLGVVGYFRDHIANHSTVVHPLYELHSTWEITKKNGMNTRGNQRLRGSTKSHQGVPHVVLRRWRHPANSIAHWGIRL